MVSFQRTKTEGIERNVSVILSVKDRTFCLETVICTVQLIYSVCQLRMRQTRETFRFTARL
jgi:hypothetical protein